MTTTKGIEIEVYYVSESGEYQDYAEWVLLKHAYEDFTDSTDENMVVEYAKLNSTKVLCEAIAVVAKTSASALFPDFYNRCVTDHKDLATFERVAYPEAFDPLDPKTKKIGKYTRPELVTKCSTCKKAIPTTGANKPTDKKPAWVCMSLANRLPCAMGGLGCFETGIACHSCQQEHACRDSPERRRRRR